MYKIFLKILLIFSITFIILGNSVLGCCNEKEDPFCEKPCSPDESKGFSNSSKSSEDHKSGSGPDTTTIVVIVVVVVIGCLIACLFGIYQCQKRSEIEEKLIDTKIQSQQVHKVYSENNNTNSIEYYKTQYELSQQQLLLEQQLAEHDRKNRKNRKH